MRDLYGAVGLSSQASTADIKRNLHAGVVSDPTVRRDIESVLLNRNRRARYDHVHRTVQCVTDLRAVLSITEQSGAAAAATIGFTRSCPSTEKPKPTSPSTAGQLDGPQRFVAVVVGGSLAVALFALTLKSGTESPPIRPDSTLLTPEQRDAVVNWHRGSSADALRPASTGSKIRSVAPASFRTEHSAASLPPRRPMPRTGLLETFDGGGGNNVLNIRPAPGNGHLYLKLSRRFRNKWILVRTGFIRRGDRFTTHLPAGTYELRYASGSVWYGTQHLFGPRTRRAKADEDLELVESDTSYSSLTVDLLLQKAGNLHEQLLSHEEF